MIDVAHALDLADAWAKLDRGREHAATLRSEIEQAGAPDYQVIAIGREFDSASSCIIFAVARNLPVSDQWGLAAGDAIHNFRCALDYLAWQLALKHYGGSIPKHEQRSVYFPITTAEGNWAQAARHMDNADAAKIATSQPFNFADQPSVAVPLKVIADLSNADKHRMINIISTVVASSTLANDGWPFRDCAPRLDAQGNMILEHRFSGQDVVGEEVCRLHVVPTGPDPDVEVNLSVSREVVIQHGSQTWPVIPALYYSGVIVEKILNRFDTFGRPPSTVEQFPGQTLLS